MGAMEKGSRKRTHRVVMRQYILAAVAMAGLLGVAAVAPNALSLLKGVGITPHKRHDEVIRRATKSLIARGFLEWSDGMLRLTKQGSHAYELQVAFSQLSKKPRKWDKKWRILIFDIPESRRKVRFAVRKKVLEAGFVRLQDSVWAFPYPCEEFVSLLKVHMSIGKDLLYLIVDSIENDKGLRTHFSLPQSE
jgi:DNA-binding transcriptional regulator PaaX